MEAESAVFKGEDHGCQFYHNLSMDNPSSITCPLCGMTSYHPKDVEHRYCGNCYQFHDMLTGKVDTSDLLIEMARIGPDLRAKGFNQREIMGEAIKNLLVGSVDDS